MTSYVTDWSNHNSGALTQSQADGLVGFWHKCTDGDHWFADGLFKTHCDMARAAGVDSLGGYHVLWGNRDLRSQAQWFVERVRAQAPDAIVFMSDNEPFGYNVAPTIAQVNEFNRLVAEIAQVPAHSVLAYCPQWHYGSSISGLQYPWIQSSYGSNPTGPYATVYQQTVGDGSSRWNGPAPMPFLQYGSRTDVGDANAFRGSAAEFFAFIGQGVISVSDAYTLLDSGVRSQDGKPFPSTATDPDGISRPISTIYNQITRLFEAIAALQADVSTIMSLLETGAPEPTPPPAVAYTVSLSGSVSAEGAVSISGAARPVPPVNGQ